MAALLFETVLFIARTSGTPGLGAKYLRYSDPKRWAQQQQPATVDVQFEYTTTPRTGGKSTPGKAESKKSK